MCHLAAGWGKDFHTGANEKQLIYLLIYKHVCAYSGERVGLCSAPCSTPEQPEGKQGRHPRTAGLRGAYRFASLAGGKIQLPVGAVEGGWSKFESTAGDAAEATLKLYPLVFCRRLLEKSVLVVWSESSVGFGAGDLGPALRMGGRLRLKACL